MNIFDFLRGAVFCLYLVLVGQIAATVYYYMKARANEALIEKVPLRGVLPSHVINVGIVFAVFATEAAWQNLSRVDEGFTWYVPLNVGAFLLANRAILLITHFEKRRLSASSLGLPRNEVKP